MPSNKDLRADIAVEANLNGFEAPDTEGKNNIQLLALLKEVRAWERPPAPEPEASTDDQDNEPAAEALQQAEMAEVPTIEPEPFPYSVASGKAVTCKKGVLDEGQELKAEYFVTGQEALDGLVDRGYAVKA